MKSIDISMGPVAKVSFTFATIAGCVLTGVGLSDFPWPRPIPWSDAGALLRFFGFLLFTAAAVSLLARRLRGAAFLGGLALAAALAVGTGDSWSLLVTLWFALASSLLGCWVLQRLRIDRGSWITSFLIGAGLYGTFAGLMAHLPVNYPGTYGLALMAPIIFGHKLLRQWYDDLACWVTEPTQKFDCNYWLDFSIAILALVLFVVALMPEVGHDALAAHLFVSAHLLQRHQWGFNAATYVWAVTPMLGDWIFAIAYMLAGETAARLTNVGFILALGWLVRDLVIWAGGSSTGARWAVLIYLSSPLVFTEGSSLFIESVWASFVVAGTLVVLGVSSAGKGQDHALAVAGILLGCGLATKAVTFTFLPVLLLPLIWYIKTKPEKINALLPGLGLFAAIGGIPYITAWFLTGNPIFPFFNQIFHSPLWPNSNFEDLRWGKGLSWDFIYSVTFQTGKYMEATAGAAGFQWLLVFLPSLIILLTNRHRRGLALVVLGILSILLCFHSTAYLRYIFPAYVILIAATGIGISSLPASAILQTRFAYGVATLAILLNILFYSAGPFVYRDFPIEAIFSDEQRDVYLARRLPIRNAVKLVNAINLQRNPVAVFGTPQVAGLAANAIMANWYNRDFQNAFLAAKTKQDVVDLILKNRVEFIIADTPPDELKAQYALLDEVSTKISQFGNINVLKFNDDLRFNKELLLNPDFVKLEGWQVNGTASVDTSSGTAVVSVSSPVTQSAIVNPGQRYKNTVVARCQKEVTQGRVQVNWHDSSDQFISTSIEVFTCKSDWQEVTMEVVAPDGAVRAYVYVTGHTETPLAFKSVSLKH